MTTPNAASPMPCAGEHAQASHRRRRLIGRSAARQESMLA